MNLAIHQYRVTLAPKFRKTSSRRRPRHASRPFPSLSLSSPAPLPEGCIRWSELLSSTVVPRKVRKWKTASPGRFSASHVSAFRLLFRASPCRCAEKYTRIIIERQAHFPKILHFFVRKFQKYWKINVFKIHFFGIFRHFSNFSFNLSE